ncbi:hypothetical protein L1887_53701 [Cichorium endivia]|nr:hypothetical protein L1887_53701 [Cichorium endivia]
MGGHPRSIGHDDFGPRPSYAVGGPGGGAGGPPGMLGMPPNAGNLSPRSIMQLQHHHMQMQSQQHQHQSQQQLLTGLQHQQQSQQQQQQPPTQQQFGLQAGIGNAASLAAPGGPAEEITTVFIVGFPDDMSEREFANMFLFAKGFEASTLKIPAGLGSAAPNGRVPDVNGPPSKRSRRPVSVRQYARLRPNRRHGARLGGSEPVTRPQPSRRERCLLPLGWCAGNGPFWQRLDSQREPADPCLLRRVSAGRLHPLPSAGLLILAQASSLTVRRRRRVRLVRLQKAPAALSRLPPMDPSTTPGDLLSPHEMFGGPDFFSPGNNPALRSSIGGTSVMGPPRVDPPARRRASQTQQQQSQGSVGPEKWGGPMGPIDYYGPESGPGPIGAPGRGLQGGPASSLQAQSGAQRPEWPAVGSPPPGLYGTGASAQRPPFARQGSRGCRSYRRRHARPRSGYWRHNEQV